MLKEYWSHGDICQIPIRNLFDELDYFTPKFKEIAKKQEAERLKAELEGKRGNNQSKPGGAKRR